MRLSASFVSAALAVDKVFGFTIYFQRDSREGAWASSIPRTACEICNTTSGLLCACLSCVCDLEDAMSKVVNFIRIRKYGLGEADQLFKLGPFFHFHGDGYLLEDDDYLLYLVRDGRDVNMGIYQTQVN